VRTTEEKHQERGKGGSYSACVGLGGFGEGFDRETSWGKREKELHADG
jgi:hypothetical protein